MGTDVTPTPVCENCGNDRFHLVSEVRRTEIVRVAVDEAGELRWEHDGHQVVPIEGAEFDRRIECTRCLESPPLAADDPLYRGTVGISREVLVNTIAVNPDTIDLQQALCMITGADTDEILALAKKHGTSDDFES